MTVLVSSSDGMSFLAEKVLSFLEDVSSQDRVRGHGDFYLIDNDNKEVHIIDFSIGQNIQDVWMVKLETKDGDSAIGTVSLRREPDMYRADGEWYNAYHLSYSAHEPRRNNLPNLMDGEVPPAPVFFADADGEEPVF